MLGVAREEVEAGRLAAVRELAGRFGATVLLKGSTTLVCGAGGAVPYGSTRPAPPGSPRPAAATSSPVSPAPPRGRPPGPRRGLLRGLPPRPRRAAGVGGRRAGDGDGGGGLLRGRGGT
ncbi:hypothetical protein O1L60_23280 [Streptomyces diastatochromogenes]|nr:hypothetical protein [Streptomyces diastatochromogenes]